MRFTLFLLLASGCGFHAVGKGDMTAGDMGVTQDLAGADLTGVVFDLAGADFTGFVDTCPAPRLLVGVENLTSGATKGGRVARVSLAAGMAQPCLTLGGQGLIGAHVIAVAAFDGAVAAAAYDGLYVIDPGADVVQWSKPNNYGTRIGPFDAFTLQKPTGAPLIAVSYGDTTSTGAGIRNIDVFDASGAPATAMQWCIQGASCMALPLSLSIYSMAANPAKPSHLLALDGSTNVAAWDVDPWTPAKTQYVGAYSEPLATVYAVAVSPAVRHIVWFDNNTGGAIQYASDTGTGAPTLRGPVKCSSGCPTILDAVPDPTAASGFLALCEGATRDKRQVVRVSDIGNCSVVLDGAQFGSLSTLTRLAIGQ